MSDITPIAREIANFADEAKKYCDHKAKLSATLKNSKDKEKLLKGKTEKEITQSYDKYILHMIKQIRKDVDIIYKEVEVKDYKPLKTDENLNIKLEAKLLEAPNKPRKKTNDDIEVDNDAFDRYIKTRKRKKKDVVVMRDYSLYEQSEYGRIANTYVEKISWKLIKNNKSFFAPMINAMKSSDFQILSNTYVSIMIFSSILAFIPFFLFVLIFFKGFIVIRIIRAIIFGIIASGSTFAILYAYPSMIVSSRKKYMEGELPFVIVHMAAVAGSGAHPMAMFNLVMGSGEYKTLEPEIKKIINYVNLFGYNLTTSLKLVAATTPLKDFGELLGGIVTTIETGGNLKEYLNIKAQESMEKYQLKREKYIQNLATFSDVYIGISVVAPMLLFMLLAIIDSPLLGGAISGVNVGTIAIIGTYVAIPLMNFVSLVILGAITPK